MDELDDVSTEHLGPCCETGECETCSECGRDLAWTMDGRRVCDNQLCSVAIAEWRRNDDARKAALCDYCGAPDVRENPEPFGGKPCCDACFNVIIGGEPDDPPWRCETGGSAR